MPKLVWLDTGLVNYAAQVQKEVLGAKDIMDAWRGMIAEQIVAQELLTLTDKVSQKRCFWVRNKSGSNAEVDYVWVQDSMVYPIEVKSGHNAHLRSLHSFMNRSVQTVAVRIWSQPYAAVSYTHLDVYKRQALSDGLFAFPIEHTQTMGKTPYVEAGVGIENIFKVLRLDYVWRLTYRDSPGIDKSGLRISLHMTF